MKLNNYKKREEGEGLKMNPAQTLLAFKVEIDDVTCITFAKSASSARYAAVTAAREAGYYQKKGWPHHLKASRRPDLDKSVLKDRGPGKCFSLEDVEHCL